MSGAKQASSQIVNGRRGNLHCACLSPSLLVYLFGSNSKWHSRKLANDRATGTHVHPGTNKSRLRGVILRARRVEYKKDRAERLVFRACTSAFYQKAWDVGGIYSSTPKRSE